METSNNKAYISGLVKLAKAGPHRPAKPVSKSAQSVTGYVADYTTTGYRGEPLFKVKTLEDKAKEYPWITSDPNYHNILVGGANAGGRGLSGLSELPFGALAKGENRELFRWNQREGIKKAIARALLSGKNPRVVGHSWGGSTIANMAKDFPDVQFYALDPTSWTGRLDEVPENLTIYRPNPLSIDREWDTGPLLTYLAPRIGGRWPKIDKGSGRTVEYYGTHVDGLDHICNEINREGRYKNILAKYAPPKPGATVVTTGVR